jgi:hypothetical protein
VAVELVGGFAPHAGGHVGIAQLGGHSVEFGVNVDAEWVHTCTSAIVSASFDDRRDLRCWGIFRRRAAVLLLCCHPRRWACRYRWFMSVVNGFVLVLCSVSPSGLRGRFFRVAFFLIVRVVVIVILVNALVFALSIRGEVGSSCRCAAFLCDDEIRLLVDGI